MVPRRHFVRPRLLVAVRKTRFTSSCRSPVPLAMDRRSFLQLALVAASLTTISAVLLLGAYRKKQQGEQQLKLEQQQQLKQQANAKDAAGPPPVEAVHAAPKPPRKPEPEPIPRRPEAPAPAPAPAAAPANVGQEEATLATKKYKAGAYEEAIELYSLAIAKCEQAEPLDARNVKVMYSNRAAAYEKLERHQSVIADCSKALKLDNRCGRAQILQRASDHVHSRPSLAIADTPSPTCAAPRPRPPWAT